MVAFGNNNDPDITITCPVSCVCCFFVEKIFKESFKEVIDYIECGERSGHEVIDNLGKENSSMTKIFRFASWIMNVLGHYLLFSPLIALMTWIPLVGYFLGAIVAFAAFLFALIWGSTIHLLIMSMAWIFYRPLVGLLMLACVFGLIGLCFM